MVTDFCTTPVKPIPWHQPHQPAAQSWANYLKSNRLKANLTKRELAVRVGCDPSSLTLCERHGHIPKRSTVARIGAAFGSPEDALLAAGFIPAGHDPQKIADSWSQLHNSLSVDVRLVCQMLATRTKAQQRTDVAQLLAYLRAVTK